MQLSRRQALTSLGAALALPCLSFPAPGLSAPGLSAPGLSRAPLWPERFLAAVREGRLERVRELLSEDPRLARSKDDAGRSAFVLAHLHGHPELASLLRAGGLELDIVEAVLAEDWERFEAQCQAHPELLNRAHPIGGTPLYAAALVGSLSCWRLRSEGCDSNAVGSGYTPVRGALESPHDSWARIGLTDIASNGGDVNARQKGGSSVLHAAVQRRDELLVRLAIRKGAAVEALDDAGRSPAALASEIGWEHGETLLRHHTQLPRDNRGSRFARDANREPIVRPDLSSIPQKQQSEVTGNSHANLKRVRELVSRDERLVFSISTDDELAIEACAHIGTRDIIRYHLDHGAPLSLPTAVSLGDREAVSYWLESDPTLVHERGAHDFPVMWYAVIGRSLEMAELLTHYQVPVDQESMGTTALHWAVRRDALDLASFLIENGADVEALGQRWERSGQTPLQVAQADQKTPFIKLLREHGARR